MGRPFKPFCTHCGAAREKGITCDCRKRASYEKHREKYNAAYTANPEPKRAYQRKYAAQQFLENPEAVVERVRVWRKANPGKSNAYSVEWRERNRAKKAAINRNWKLANPDAVKLHTQNRRTRLKGNGGKLTVPQWQGICESQEQKCFDCHELKPLTIGHIIPVCLGGSSNFNNIIAQCQACNNKQGRLVHPAFRDRVIVGEK